MENFNIFTLLKMSSQVKISASFFVKKRCKILKISMADLRKNCDKH